MLGTASPRTRTLAGGDLALVVVIAVVVGVAATVWLAGELAALLTSGHTIAVGPGELGHVLARLPDHLDDPARAWPPDARRALPGPAGCYLAAVVVPSPWAVPWSRWCARGAHRRWAGATSAGRAGPTPATCGACACVPP